MRLATSSLTATLIAQMQQLTTQQAMLQNQVSSGQRISQPGDDPVAVAHVVAAQMEQSALTQAGHNADAALGASQNTFAALTQFKSISDRVGEIGALGGGAIGTAGMQAYAQEVNQLIEQAVTTGNSSFDQNHLFAGTASGTPPFTVTRDAAGQVTAVAYVGSATSASVPLGSGVTVQPTTDGATNAGLATFMNRLVALRDSLQTGDSAATQAAAAALPGSEDTIVGALSEQGAVQSRIQLTQTTQQSRLTELAREVSAAADTDLPSTIVRLNQSNQTYQAALSASSKILNLSLLDYLH